MCARTLILHRSIVCQNTPQSRFCKGRPRYSDIRMQWLKIAYKWVIFFVLFAPVTTKTLKLEKIVDICTNELSLETYALRVEVPPVHFDCWFRDYASLSPPQSPFHFSCHCYLFSFFFPSLSSLKWKES